MTAKSITPKGGNSLSTLWVHSLPNLLAALDGLSPLGCPQFNLLQRDNGGLAGISRRWLAAAAQR